MIEIALIDPIITALNFNALFNLLYTLAAAIFELNIAELVPREPKLRPTFDVGKFPFNTTFLTGLIVSLNIVIVDVFERETTSSIGVTTGTVEEITPNANFELTPVLYPVPPLLILNVKEPGVF